MSANPHRRVIHIRAEDSPNVKLALLQKAAGIVPTGEIIVPGVLTWSEYETRRANWDEARQRVGLDAEFPSDSGVLLFPPDWLDNSELLYVKYHKGHKRQARAMGIDSGEGSANTCWCVGDDLGVLELVSLKTKDTSFITRNTIDLGRRWGVPAEKWMFDAGGGGKQHADRLRLWGYKCQTVPFGEKVLLDLKRGLTRIEERRDNREDRYAYLNRRAQMYDLASQMIDPEGPRGGYAIPPDWAGPQYKELRRQLAPLPKKYDGEGRMYLPPKNKRSQNSTEMTLTGMLGCSPDEADSFVLMIYGLTHKSLKAKAGVS